MTTIAEAREAVYSLLATEWQTGGVPETPFFFDNEVANDAPDIAAVNGKPAEFIRCVVRQLPSAQETLGRVGNRRFVRPANIAIQVFVQTGTGTARTGQMVERLKEIFEARRIGPDLITNAMTVAEIGPDGAYFQTNVTVALVAYETR